MDSKRPHVETGNTPGKRPIKLKPNPTSPSAVRNLFNSFPSEEQPGVDQAQAQAAIDAENHAAPPHEQPQAQHEVPAQPNGEPAPAPAPTSLSEPRVDQAQAAIDTKNHAAPPQEQPQAHPEVQAPPNAETVPAPTSHSESLPMSEEEAKLLNYHFTDADVMWMKVALTVASRAEISEYAKEKPNVGCVIRRSRSKGPPAVLAVGWNGFPPKIPDDILEADFVSRFWTLLLPSEAMHIKWEIKSPT